MIDLLNNNVIRGLAVLAVIVTGVAWMFGHVDLRRAGTVVLGIMVIFGAATIVDLITGGRARDPCPPSLKSAWPRTPCSSPAPARP